MVTVRDFTQIFDAYAEYSETLISGLMDMIANAEPDDEDAAETEKDLDQQMKDFEELMDRRPFLVNEVLLRRNPNDVQEWEKRITLYGDNDEKVSDIREPRIPLKLTFPVVGLGRRNLHQSPQDDQSEESDCQLLHALR